MTRWTFDEPEERRANCPCCDRPMRKIVGGIFEEGAADPHALYVAQLTPGSHPAPRVQVALCIGDWSPTGKSEERRIVGAEIWRDGDQIITGLIDAVDSLLGGTEMGVACSAASVRESPWRSEVFELSDALLREHRFLREHLWPRRLGASE